MIELRAVEEKDNPFILSVYRCSREEELALTNWPEVQKNAFVHMQLMAQLSEYKEKFPGAVFQVISFKKKDAGRLYTWEGDTEFRLIDITLLPAFRGKGIGKSILCELIKRSEKLKKKITLHVDPANKALQLYLSLGFTPIKNNGRHYYMERTPTQL